MKLRKVVRVLFRATSPVVRLGLLLFFRREYLTGRHFDGGLGGYVWAIRSAWSKNILRLGRPMPWPTALTCTISNPSNIVFHPDDLNNFQSPGVYLQNFSAKIVIGRGTYIAPNVGIITSNHDLLDLDSHVAGQDVVLGERCWIGMGAVILPGVRLGAGSIVAAGAVVNKSYPDGGLLLAGVPARPIKKLDEAKVDDQAA
ncbi:acyltransferase [Thermomonas paludicola]|uniref:acyltransferase n=1 Tax=Thermomonas paludicola TaxID=2884874 RepID=UPI002113F4B2|nr:acyltransferase [Thermomonas paludicola]